MTKKRILFYSIALDIAAGNFIVLLHVIFSNRILFSNVLLFNKAQKTQKAFFLEHLQKQSYVFMNVISKIYVSTNQIKILSIYD